MSTPSVPNGHDRTGSGSPAPAGPENPRSAESRSHESRSGMTHDPHDSRDRDGLAKKVEDAKARRGLTKEQIDRQAHSAVSALRREKKSSSIDACHNWIKAQGLVVGKQKAFRESVNSWNAFFDRREAESVGLPEMPEEMRLARASQAEIEWRETYRTARSVFEAERAELEGKLKEAETARDKAITEFDRLRHETDDDMIRLNAEADEAKGQVEGLIARASAAEARVQILEATAAAAKENEEARQAELTGLRDRLAERERQSGESQGRAKAAEKVEADLRSSLDDAVSKQAAAETRATIAETRLEDMRARAERAEDRLDRSANQRPGSAPLDGSPDADPEVPLKPDTPAPKRGRGRGPTRDG